jgi:hypothetical protein
MSFEINKLQKILGRSGENHLKASASAYGIKVFGKLEACESYATSKAQQTKTNKYGLDQAKFQEKGSTSKLS